MWKLVSTTSDTDSEFDYLCETCASIFDTDVIQLIVEPAEGTYLARPHLLCGQLQESAKRCHLCRWILASALRQGDEDNFLGHGIYPEVSGEAAFSGDFENERLQLEFGVIQYEAVGISISTAEPKIQPLSGWIMLSPISDQKIHNLSARRQGKREGLGQETLTTIRNWMDACLENHKPCSHSNSTISSFVTIPARLLQILDNDETVKLIPTNELSQPVQYLTLSHCWGQSVCCRLLEDNLKNYQGEIPSCDLTKTFKEAIHLTKRLGFSYLWIDALCIIQDSEADWCIESLKMGDIYTQGVLNIAAASSQDGDGGLFHSKSHLSPMLLRCQHTDSRLAHFVSHGNMVHRDIERSPLASRGWVVQERLLSPRAVHFLTNQVFWECVCHFDAEILPESIFRARHEQPLPKKLLSSKYTKPQPDQTPESIWNHVVSTYSRCNLSYHTVKLPAIAGLTLRLATQWSLEPTNYLAGLWKGDLLNQLLRQVRWHKRNSLKPDRAPSWSWARIDNQIDFSSPKSNMQYCAKVLKTWVEAPDGFLFSRSNGYIKLQAPLYGIILSNRRMVKTLLDPPRFDFETTGDKLQIPAWLITWDYSEVENYFNDDNFHLTLICGDNSSAFPDCWGIILKPMRGFYTTGRYERVGVIRIRERLQKFFDFSKRIDHVNSVQSFDVDAEGRHTFEIS